MLTLTKIHCAGANQQILTSLSAQLQRAKKSSVQTEQSKIPRNISDRTETVCPGRADASW